MTLNGAEKWREREKNVANKILREWCCKAVWGNEISRNQQWNLQTFSYSPRSFSRFFLSKHVVAENSFNKNKTLLFHQRRWKKRREMKKLCGRKIKNVIRNQRDIVLKDETLSNFPLVCCSRCCCHQRHGGDDSQLTMIISKTRSFCTFFLMGLKRIKGRRSQKKGWKFLPTLISKKLRGRF